jgi:hypothetical protein
VFRFFQENILATSKKSVSAKKTVAPKVKMAQKPAAKSPAPVKEIAKLTVKIEKLNEKKRELNAAIAALKVERLALKENAAPKAAAPVTAAAPAKKAARKAKKV